MKSIKYLLLCFFLFTAVNSNAQIPALAFQKSFGGSSLDEPFAAHPTSDGGFIVIGYAASTDGDVSSPIGGGDVWVIKLDSAFNVQWKKCYGGSVIDEGIDIIERNGGGYIFLATTSSNDIEVSGNHGARDYWVVKLDNAGNLLWQKCYGGTYYEMAHSLALTSDGGFIAAGQSTSNDGDVTGHHGISTQEDYWVVKADSSGTIQWENSFGGSQWDYAYSVLQTFDGGYMVGGVTNSGDGDITGSGYHASDDIWILKLDSSGSVQWKKCYGGTSIDILTKIIQTKDSGYVMTGGTWSTDGDVTSNQNPPDAWIVKTDAAGNLSWQKSYGGITTGDRMNSVVQTNDGSYMLAGSTGSNDGDVSGNHGSSDVWIIKLDSAGDLQWQKCYGGTNDEYNPSIDASPDGYIVTVQSSSNNIDLVSNKGNYDLWIFKLAAHSNSITGQVYLDTITNGVHDAAEPLLSNKLISESTTGRITFTDNNGMYDMPVFTPGTYSVQAPSVNYYTCTPSSYPVTFASIDEIDSLNDFPAAPVPGMNDLQITLIPLSDFTAGFAGSYRLVCKNVGTTTQSATVKLFPGNYISYYSASVTPSMITTDSITWNNINLVPWQEENIDVEFSVSTSATIGAYISTSCIIEPVAGDMDVTNNTSEWRVPVTASFDPNEKVVSDTLLTTTQLSSQPWLDYVIHFQNTGTDTAVNVMISDNIRSGLDITTFEFENASHPVRIEYQQASKLITFHFDNIQLPDSNVNEAASHGFVQYRIKPYDTLAAGSIIRNRAAIYFDFNEPVLTNITFTHIMLPVSVEEENEADFPGIRMYPDPADKDLVVSGSEELADLSIFDISGRALVKSELKGKRFILNVSSFNDGIYLLRASAGKKQFYKKFAVRH